MGNGGTPQLSASSISSSASALLVRCLRSGGSPALRARSRSANQLSGTYKRQPSGQLSPSPLQCKLTATWQLAILPNAPQYCRATATECAPALGKIGRASCRERV